MQQPPTAAQNSASHSATPWFDIGLLLCAGIVAAFHVGKVPPALPLLRAELGFGLTTAGWVLSTVNIVGMSLGMAAGLLADRIGARRLLLAGLALLAIADIAGSLAQDVVAIVLGRFLEGVGFFAVVVAAPPSILRLASARDAKLGMALWSTYMPAGTAIMMLVAPFLLQWIGWRGLWLANGALAMLCLLALLVRGQAAATHAQARIDDLWLSMRATLAGKGALLLALCFGTYTFCWMALVGFLPTYMIEQRGIAPGTAGLLTAAVVAANIFGNLGSSPLQALGLPRWTLIWIAALAMAIGAIVAFDETAADIWRYLACLGFSAIGGIAPGALFASVPYNAPRPALIGTTGGLMMQGSNFGSTLGPPALALFVTASGGWQHGAWLLCAILAASAAGAFLLGRSEAARGAAP